MTTVYENKLKSLFRVSWTSAQAAAIWAPRVARIKTMLSKHRKQLVLNGIIAFYQDNIFAHQEDRLIEQLNQAGLDYTSLHNRDRNLQHLIHYSKLEDEARHTYFVGKSVIINQIREKINSNNNAVLFELAGMPSCCAESYKWFIESGWHDPLTWLAVEKKDLPEETTFKAGRLLLSQAFELPDLGLFACSSECEKAEVRWQTIIEQLKRIAPKEATWFDEILDWPMHWSALHGIAELKTPVAKCIYRADATSDKKEIRFEGSTYPEEGARGLAFPYRE